MLSAVTSFTAGMSIKDLQDSSLPIRYRHRSAAILDLLALA